MQLKGQPCYHSQDGADVLDGQVINIKQALESTKNLTASKKALLAYCLVSSLESIQDEGVEEAWSELTENLDIGMSAHKMPPIGSQEL